MKLPIYALGAYALAAASILAVPAPAAPRGPSLARPPQPFAPGNLRRPGDRGYVRAPLRVFGRSYYPFWGGFCSNAPLGPLVNPQWYYCFPGYDWDYGEPYYWAFYTPGDTLLPAPDEEGAAASCGDWIWHPEQKKYSWDEAACPPAAPPGP